MCVHCQDKRELMRANKQLARENAQLQELLAYLSGGMDTTEVCEGEVAEV